MTLLRNISHSLENFQILSKSNSDTKLKQKDGFHNKGNNNT